MEELTFRFSIFYVDDNVNGSGAAIMLNQEDMPTWFGATQGLRDFIQKYALDNGDEATAKALYQARGSVKLQAQCIVGSTQAALNLLSDSDRQELASKISKVKETKQMTTFGINYVPYNEATNKIPLASLISD